MENHEDEILQRLEELRVWQEAQTNGEPLSESQQKLLHQLGISFDQSQNIYQQIETESINNENADDDDDQFFLNIERQIQELRSGNASMRGQHNQSLDETPVMSRRDVDFDATPLRSIDLNQIDVEEPIEVRKQDFLNSIFVIFFFLKFLQASW